MMEIPTRQALRMSLPTVSQIENAFQPAKEIDSAERFAGRTHAVQDAYYALLAAGSNIAIVGNRGIGKTSLARQVVAIASGDNSLLTKLGINAPEKLDFVPVYFACGNGIANVDALLERLLTTQAALAGWVYDVPKAKKEIVSYTPKFGAKLFAVEVAHC